MCARRYENAKYGRLGGNLENKIRENTWKYAYTCRYHIFSHSDLQLSRRPSRMFISSIRFRRFVRRITIFTLIFLLLPQNTEKYSTLLMPKHSAASYISEKYITFNDNKLISRWDSERELFYDHIVHVLQITINSRINSATGRRSSLQPEVKHQHKERNGTAKLKR